MLIKQADDKSADLATLTALLAHPQAGAQTRERIQDQIRQLQAGMRAEQEAAYELDFHHKNTDNWAVIHDLRIEWQGRVAQIDHLLISRLMEMYVCETKSFSQGVAMNERGEFTAFYQGKPRGIPSPLEQNRRHIAVLDAVLRGSPLVQLPKRLGLTLQPKLTSVVLVGPHGRITLPKQAVPGAESIVKSDQLRSWIERADQNAGLDALIGLTKAIGTDTLAQLARQIARLHKPLKFDWHGKFGLPVLDGVAPVALRAPVRPAGEPAIAVRADAQARPQAASADNREMARAVTAPVVQSLARPSGSAATRASGSSAEGGEVEKLSTSKLGRAWGLDTAGQTLQRLEALGYLHPTDGGHRLSDKALAVGAEFVEKSRFGPYFRWPADLPQR